MTRSVLDTPAAATPLIRRPSQADAARLYALVEACRPLDLNSRYAYLLLSTHFAATCAIAELEDDPLGFVAAYLKPTDPTVLFVWQIAVHSRARGRGLGGRLLDDVLGRPECRAVLYLEATITPSNEASWKLFRAFARARGAACRESAMFDAADFGASGHEREQLLRIGPLRGQNGM